MQNNQRHVLDANQGYETKMIDFRHEYNLQVLAEAEKHHADECSLKNFCDLGLEKESLRSRSTLAFVK